MANYVYPPLPVDGKATFYTSAGTYYGMQFTLEKASTSSIPKDPLTGETSATGTVPPASWEPVTIGLENGPLPLDGYIWTVQAYTSVVTVQPGNAGDPTAVPPVPATEDVVSETRSYPNWTLSSADFQSNEELIKGQLDGEYYLKAPTFGGCILMTPVPSNRYNGNFIFGAGEIISGGIAFTQKNSSGPSGSRVKGYIDTEIKLDLLNVPTTDANDSDFFLGTDGIGYKKQAGGLDRWQFINDTGGPGVIQPVTAVVDYVSDLPKNPSENNFYVLKVAEDFEFYNGYYGNEAFKAIGSGYEHVTNPYQFSGYLYGLIFDQSEFEYIPRTQGPTTNTTINVKDSGGWFPLEPYDTTANPPVYPMSTITTFIPDQREAVTVTYTATVTGGISGISNVVSTTFTWTQTVEQPNENWGDKLRALLNTYCYYSQDQYQNYCYTTNDFSNTDYCDPINLDPYVR